MIYDCVVAGVGGVGSAALLAAARRNWKVLGIEQFGSAHDRGSSHGQTRLIRTAYYEHPNYVPLARIAWEKWQQLQSRCGSQLVQRTGLLQVGRESGELIRGVLDSASQHNIEIEQLTSQQWMQRFPAFRLDSDHIGIFEKNAGFILVEKAVAQFIRMAIEAGAEFRPNCPVSGITVETDDLIHVHTDDAKIQTRRLIIAAGPWSNRLLGSLPLDISVVSKQQQWFQIDRVDIKHQNGFPAWLIEDGERYFYGFPEIDYLGMKVAEHTGGQHVDDPAEVSRDCKDSAVSLCEDFIDRHFEISRRRLVHSSICFYSNSRDGHFIVDHHPDSQKIVFAAGLSGHGFKFAPILGERLVGLLENELDEMFEFLKMEQRQLGT